MGLEDLTNLKVDIEKRSAKLLMFYFSYKCDIEEDAVVLMGLGSIENVTVSRDGDTVTAYILFDYGKMIPEVVWAMFGKDSLVGIMDTSTSTHMTNEAILESVKILYPRAQKILKKSAEDLFSGLGQEEK